jgi:hypothetical protein
MAHYYEENSNLRTFTLDSYEMFPDNTANEFRGELIRPIDGSIEYLEVAVVNLVYHPIKIEKAKAKCLVILCDLVDYSQFGSKSLQVLTVFENDEIDGSPNLETFRGFEYTPVKRQKNIGTVHIQLVDEYMKPISCIQNSKTIITLNVRSRKYY